MAEALTALQRVAASLETTGGTLAAATRLVPHLTGSSFTPTRNRQRLDEARGVLAYVDDVVTRQMSTLELQQEFDFDLCLLAFLCGFHNVTPSGGGPYVYAMEAGPSAPSAKGSASWEVIQHRSGSLDDAIMRRSFAHARPTQIALEWQDGGTTRMNTTWVGGAATEPGAAATIAASTLATRRVVPASLWTIAVDDAWGDLGNTLATNVRGMSWSLNTGVQPSYHLTGRANHDLDGWYDGRLALAFSMALDFDAAAAERVEDWEEGDLLFVRLQSSRGSGAGLRQMRIDQAVRIIGSPNLLGSDGEQATVALECELRSDAAGAANNMLAINLTNGLAAWNTGAGIPTVPRSLNLTPGNDQIAASWAAPQSTGGSSITRYNIAIREGSSGPWFQVNSGTSRTHTFTGLSSGVAYQVRVQAVNAVGVSEWSAAASSTTT